MFTSLLTCLSLSWAFTPSAPAVAKTPDVAPATRTFLEQLSEHRVYLPSADTVQAGVAVVALGAAAYCIYRALPSQRLSQVTSINEQLLSHPLVKNEFVSDEDYVAKVDLANPTSRIALQQAFDELTPLEKLANEGVMRSQYGIDRTCHDHSPELWHDLQATRDRSQTLQKTIALRLAALKNHPRFHNQWQVAMQEKKSQEHRRNQNIRLCLGGGWLALAAVAMYQIPRLKLSLSGISLTT